MLKDKQSYFIAVTILGRNIYFNKKKFENFSS